MKARYASHYTTWDYVFSPGIEPGTFCVLDRCDNHYTTKTTVKQLPESETSNPKRVRVYYLSIFNLLAFVFTASRDRIVVSTLRCGRSNPGSNPGHGSAHFFVNMSPLYTGPHFDNSISVVGI